MRRLTILFPSEFLEEHAEEPGVVERDRELQIPVLVWAFVFSFAASERRTLAVFRQSYNSTADKTLSTGGFYQRLTPQLAEFISDLVKRRIDEVAVPHTISDKLDRFRDIIVADGTILRLHEFLAEEFQPRRGEQGGARVISAIAEYSDSVFLMMNASRRFEVVEHLSDAELDDATDTAQEADETRIVQRFCFVSSETRIDVLICIQSAYRVNHLSTRTQTETEVRCRSKTTPEHPCTPHNAYRSERDRQFVRVRRRRRQQEANITRE